MSRDRSRTEFPGEGERNQDPYDREDRSASGGDDGPTLPGVIPFGWPTALRRGATDDTPPGGGVDADGGGSYRREVERADVDDTWIDEGVIALTLVVGVALFLFPEPATSGLGLVLIVVGVLAWLVDWAT